MLTADQRLAIVRVKIDWAKRQLDNLSKVKEAFISRDPYGPAVDLDLEADKHLFKMLYVEPPEPAIALIAGDVIHNTRSALDHLAWQLVEANGIAPTKFTCFPITNSAESYQTIDRRKVDGMRQEAKDLLDATQPYKGGLGNYLWILHTLDIADKHRTLLTAVNCLGRASIEINRSMLKVPSLYEAFGRFTAEGFSQPLKAGDVFFTCDAGKDQNIKFTFEIGFNEPCIGEIQPIIPYLDLLI